MDGLVVPLDEKLLVACIDALEPWVVKQLRDWGFEVYDPDMSMFTLGGGGVHCLAQALCRESVLQKHSINGYPAVCGHQSTQ